MIARSSRRALLVGTAATVPVLGTAALPATAGATTDPDAELLTLAAELRAAEDAYTAAACQLDATGEDSVADAVDAASEVLEGLLARMASLPAHGLAGVAAKAARLTYTLADGTTIMHAEQPLVASLARDLAQLVPQAVQPVAATIRPSPDAELLALAAEIEAVEAQQDAMAEPYSDAPGGWPDDVYEAVVALTPRYHALVDRFYRIPARTLPGLQAKARIAMPLLDTQAEGGPGEDDRLAWSLCRDILVLAEDAA